MSEFTPTPEQQKAIDYPGNAVITACAGSGKTSVISQKVAAALSRLPRYRGVIAISYTNKASNELRQRCEKLVPDVKRSYFGTIDRFCISEIVIPFFSHLISQPLPNVSVRAIRTLSEDQQLFGRDLRGLTTSDIPEILPHALKLLSAGIVALETVGILSVHVLRISSACRAYVKARYTHVFIDEYQDSGEAQHSLFLELKTLGLTAVAVGDANQSIFGYDRRDSRFLNSLCESGSGFAEFELNQNHRCHPSITNYANRLLNGACSLIPVTETKVFRRCIDGSQVQVAHWIEKNIDVIKGAFGIEHNSDAAILVRNSYTADIISRELKIPSRVFVDSKMANSIYRSSSIFAGLLELRFNQKATVQSFMETLLLDRMTRSEVAIIRQGVRACREVDHSRLKAQLVWTANLILGEEVSQGSIDELDLVLNDPSQVSLFFPVKKQEIQIMTLHKAKGLEFSFVFHLDLYDWVMPQRVFEQGSYEVKYVDEKQCLNLHYVGITRARKGCVLLHSTRRVNSNGETKSGYPSQFFQKPGLEGLFA